MDVEALAVNAISNAISVCPHLKAYLTTNDKTPFTDGHIDLYRTLPKTNETWEGRVPVQVKGRSRQAKQRALSTYSINRSDLIAFQKDSGVLYFVVAVDEHGRSTPYYALLAPFSIASYLNRAGSGQKRISVPIKAFPQDPAAIEPILALALKTREQRISVGFDPVLIERMQRLTIHSAAELDFDSPVTLTSGTNDFALVLHTTDGLSVQLGGELRLFPSEYMDTDIVLQSRCGAITYNNATVRRIDPEHVEVSISEGLRLRLSKTAGKQTTQVSLTLEDTLAGRLKAIEFYTALLDTRLIHFDGEPWPVEVTRSDDNPWLRRHLGALRKLTVLLTHLGVDTRLIDVRQVDDTQARQLNVLYRAIVDNEEITDPSLKTSPGLQSVGSWHVFFVASPGSASNTWRLADPFSAESQAVLRWASANEDGGEEDSGEEVPITAYDLLDREHLCTVLNAHLDLIVGAYEAIAEFPKTFTLANQRVLALIAAADACELRTAELLDAAGRLNDWLLTKQPGEPHHLINGLQIAARTGDLSEQDRSALRDLRRRLLRSGAEDVDQFELACAILLGDADEIRHLVAQMPPDRLRRVQGWPIWNLAEHLT